MSIQFLKGDVCGSFRGGTYLYAESGSFIPLWHANPKTQ